MPGRHQAVRRSVIQRRTLSAVARCAPRWAPDGSARGSRRCWRLPSPRRRARPPAATAPTGSAPGRRPRRSRRIGSSRTDPPAGGQSHDRRASRPGAHLEPLRHRAAADRPGHDRAARVGRGAGGRDGSDAALRRPPVRHACRGRRHRQRRGTAAREGVRGSRGEHPRRRASRWRDLPPVRLPDVVRGRGSHAAARGGAAFTETTRAWPLLSGVDVRAPRRRGRVVAFGASSVDGNGSPTDANHRFTDYLARRLARTPGPRLSVLNQGIAGKPAARGRRTRPSARAWRTALARTCCCSRERPTRSSGSARATISGSRPAASAKAVIRGLKTLVGAAAAAWPERDPRPRPRPRRARRSRGRGGRLLNAKVRAVNAWIRSSSGAGRDGRPVEGARRPGAARTSSAAALRQRRRPAPELRRLPRCRRRGEAQNTARSVRLS